jgi:hypothetical protein
MAVTQHIYALFDDPESGFAAYEAVQDSGCSSEHCSAVLHETLIDNSLDPANDRASREGATRGAAIGGIVGAVLGGAAAIVGGIVAIGPLAAALVGGGLLAGYGALAGGIAGSDEPEKHLRELEDAVNEGKILLAVQTDDPDMKTKCENVFKQFGGRLVAA